MKRGVGLLLCFGVAVSLTVAPAAPARQLDTAFLDPWQFEPQLAPSPGLISAAFARARNEAGARSARLRLIWHHIAPGGVTRPVGFDARNPAEPRYQWSAFDEQVRAAASAGIDPLVYIERAPEWAENNGNGPFGRPSEVRYTGIWKPSPSEFGAFAEATAKRYSGTFCDPAVAGCVPPCGDDPAEVCLPRVRFWQALNEPNRVYNLYPQYVNGKLFASKWYRRMVNSFAEGVHTVPGNLVVAGGQAAHRKASSAAPMAFMRSMLCMSKKPYRPVCKRVSSFDAWSHHPYACGGPNREAYSSEDVQLADLPEMRSLLSAAIRYNRVQSSRRVRFWVTEVGWSTRPPLDEGVPLALHARWVAETLYRSERARVSFVTWFLLVDRVPGSPAQSGLYFYDGTPKTRSLLAFRFPFVAYVRSERVYTWGRIPWDAPSQYVTVERRTRSGAWRAVGRVWAASGETFSKTFRSTTRGSYRARVTLNDASVLTANRFSLRRPKDPYICPFGNG